MIYNPFMMIIVIVVLVVLVVLLVPWLGGPGHMVVFLKSFRLNVNSGYKRPIKEFLYLVRNVPNLADLFFYLNNCNLEAGIQSYSGNRWFVLN